MQIAAFDAAAHGQAEAPAAAVPVVTIQAIKDPVTWRYSTLLAGLDAFDSERALAPSATLRFEIRNPRKIDGLALRLVGERATVEVPLEANSLFTLSRDMDEDTDESALTLNQSRGDFDCDCLPKAVVRTRDLPANTVRMGDLRLECQVTMAIAKKHLGFFQSVGISMLGGADWCDPRQPVNYSLAATQPFNTVTFSGAGKRVTRQYEKTATTFKLRLTDRAWPDDTLIEFSQAPVPARAPAPP